MTTIAGIKGEGFITISAETQITNRDQRNTGANNRKVYRLGDYIIGTAGDARFTDAIVYQWKPPAIDYKIEARVQMGTRVIPSLEALFKRLEYVSANKDHAMSEIPEYVLLLGFGENIFTVESNLAFFQNNLDVYGIGSGGQYALGSLLTQPNGIFTSPTLAKAALNKAIKIASKIDVNTGTQIQNETIEYK
jgi:ATP-dependent protease HslVU (ClpYQ) peptidase subunit